MGLAVGLSGEFSLPGSKNRSTASVSPARNSDPESGSAGPSPGGLNPTCDESHLPALVCNPSVASVGGRVRHQDGAGTTGTPGCQDHDDLHPRAQPWRSRGKQPP